MVRLVRQSRQLIKQSRQTDQHICGERKREREGNTTMRKKKETKEEKKRRKKKGNEGARLTG